MNPDLAIGDVGVDAQILAVGAHLAHVRPDDPDALVWWVEYGRLRWLRYHRRCYVDGRAPDRVELDAVIDSLGRGLAAPGYRVAPESRAWLAGLLGDALRERYGLDPTDPTDLARAVELSEGALDQAGAGSQDWFDRAERLADLYLDRAELTGDGTDLDRAVELLRRLVAARPAPPLAEAGYAWEQLGHAYASRHERRPDPADRDRALTAFHAASGAGWSCPSAATLQARLLTERATATGRDEDFAAAISAISGARTGGEEDGPDDARAHLDDLGRTAHLDRYLARAGRGDPGDLRAAARYAANLLANAATDAGRRDAARLVLSMARVEQARCDDGAADLDTTVADLAGALPRATAHLRAPAARVLALGLLERAWRQPRPHLVDHALRYARGGLDRMPGDDAWTAELTGALAFAVVASPDLGRLTWTDLTRVIDLLGRVAGEEPADQAVHRSAAIGRAGALACRAATQGDQGTLDAAIASLADAVRPTSATGPARTSAVLGLANALRCRHATRGDRADLRRAVTVLRDTWSRERLDRHGRYAVGVALAQALLREQVETGRHDIDEAVGILHECLPAVTRWQAAQARVFSVLGIGFLSRALATGSPSDRRSATRYAHLSTVAARSGQHAATVRAAAGIVLSCAAGAADGPARSTCVARLLTPWWVGRRTRPPRPAPAARPSGMDVPPSSPRGDHER